MYELFWHHESVIQHDTIDTKVTITKHIQQLAIAHDSNPNRSIVLPVACLWRINLLILAMINFNKFEVKRCKARQCSATGPFTYADAEINKGRWAG